MQNSKFGLASQTAAKQRVQSMLSGSQVVQSIISQQTTAHLDQSVQNSNIQRELITLKEYCIDQSKAAISIFSTKFDILDGQISGRFEKQNALINEKIAAQLTEVEARLEAKYQEQVQPFLEENAKLRQQIADQNSFIQKLAAIVQLQAAHSDTIERQIQLGFGKAGSQGGEKLEGVLESLVSEFGGAV